jgi:hypothetical protein
MEIRKCQRKISKFYSATNQVQILNNPVHCSLKVHHLSLNFDDTSPRIEIWLSGVLHTHTISSVESNVTCLLKLVLIKINFQQFKSPPLSRSSPNRSASTKQRERVMEPSKERMNVHLPTIQKKKLIIVFKSQLIKWAYNHQDTGVALKLAEMTSHTHTTEELEENWYTQ